MENLESNNCPPAIIQKEYPIIRCEDCHDILTISFNMSKREISLRCEKEQKIKNIPFEEFFETINKYEDINCCQFCKDKKPSENYYICKTCSNKILCSNCFKEHNKEDDIIKFKVDSSCKRHCNPYEFYCPICKENKCSYCSIDHEEEHEKKEILLKNKMFKNKKLDEFKKNVKAIIVKKDKMENIIESVIKELEEKITFIKNLKNKFFESLKMQLKITDLVLQNYEKKLIDFDLNYFIINNLENQINFNLNELNFNSNDSLEQKIEKVTSYMNENLKNQFKLKENDLSNNNLINENDDIIDVNYNLKKKFNFNVKGILDFNKYLLALINELSIIFISKNNFENKFEINEKCIYNLKLCKKIDEENILVSTSSNIIIIKIIENCDYNIIKNYNLDKVDSIDFNSHLDLLYMKMENNYGYSYDNSQNISLNLLSFPDYNKKKKISLSIKSHNYDRLLFINDNSFFCLGYNYIGLYKINDNKLSAVNKANIDIDSTNCEIIDLNSLYYCMNDHKKILLLNKSNLLTSKTIKINSTILGFLKISHKIVSLFLTKNNLFYQNYDILFDGIKWDLNKEENIFNNSNFTNWSKSNNFIIFSLEDYYNGNKSILLEIKTKTNDEVEKISKE